MAVIICTVKGSNHCGEFDGDVEGSHVCEEHHGYKESTRTQNTCKKINIIVERDSI